MCDKVVTMLYVTKLCVPKLWTKLCVCDNLYVMQERTRTRTRRRRTTRGGADLKTSDKNPTQSCGKNTYRGSTWHTSQSGNSWAWQTIYISIYRSIYLFIYLRSLYLSVDRLSILSILSIFSILSICLSISLSSQLAS